MNTISPKISCIVPVYNTSKYLNQCIDSILNQTYSNFELLLINDGSTDNSGEICDLKALSDHRIKVYHNKNKGVSSARNTGIKESKGDYICFIDSDDWINQNSFLEISKSLVKNNTDFVIWGMKLRYANYVKELNVPNCNYYSKLDDIRLLLVKIDLTGLLESPCNKLYNNVIIKNNNLFFDEEVSYLEDMKFNCNYIQKINSICSINKPLYNYRKEINFNSLSKNYPLNLVELTQEINSLRIKLFSPFLGAYKDEYTLFLQSLLDRAKMSLNIVMYSKNMTSKMRKHNWDMLLKSYNKNSFKNTKIKFLLMLNNSFLIDFAFRIIYSFKK
jgi:glycosyltransferase involved in cell wall biosynthesis